MVTEIQFLNSNSDFDVKVVLAGHFAVSRFHRGQAAFGGSRPTNMCLTSRGSCSRTTIIRILVVECPCNYPESRLTSIYNGVLNLSCITCNSGGNWAGDHGVDKCLK